MKFKGLTKFKGETYMMKRIFPVLIVLAFSQHSFAASEGQIRFGAQGGHVGLLDTVGEKAGNAVGFGGIFNYAMSEEMMLELTYTTSSHTGSSVHLRHNDFGAGVNFYFNSYDMAFFYAAAGVNFISHELTDLNKTATGFGLYGGLGVDIDLGKNFSSGVQAIYHKAFDSSVDIGGVSQKAIQDYVTVMVRLLFVIPKS